MFEIETLPWFVLLIPLISAVVITLGFRKDPVTAGRISVSAVVLSFLLSVVLFTYLQQAGHASLPPTKINWLTLGKLGTPDFLQMEIGLATDSLSLMMMLVVTGVGSLIHIYSLGYMKGDEGFSRFFACLSLFIFSMLGIVLADNLLMLFIFWELVGVSSYLLIGFWYERGAAADACKKAFITNRIGDFGFLLGILIVWASLGSLNFEFLKMHLGVKVNLHGALTEVAHVAQFRDVATVAGLLLFCGAMGKSAQFPLHVWLPDAMEGPTPVSALIHAATMVAAGVYMLCRIFFILNAPGSEALHYIAWIGGFTALLAALIAVQQNDIKRILAYSTLSQLGYMVMAVGLGGQTPAMYHLTTHAFFKALLFLGAGSIIHSLHHEQNIWKMGGLRKTMPVTYWTFLVGTLALCGLWPFSGFYSKDSILAQALEAHNYGLFTLGVFVAGLTTFYMSRLVLIVFLGGPRSHAAEHPHEAPDVMVWPLRILAVPSIIGGLLGIDAIFGKFFELKGEELGFMARLFEPFNTSPAGAFAGLLAIIFGLAGACALYLNASFDPLPAKLGWLSRAMRNRFYFDELYENILIPCTQEALATLANGLDRWVIGGLVRFVHGTTEFSGRGLRLFQSGNLQTYAFLLVAGVAVVLYFIILAH